MARRSVRLVVLAAAIPLLLGAGAVPGAEGSGGGSASCRNVRVPVALTPGMPVNKTIFGRLCLPAGPTPETVQLLVAGITYGNGYWDFPDPSGGTDRYSYVAAANDAGDATLAIDRIGIGKSSRPLGALVTIDSNAHTVHQVVTALRNGLATNAGTVSFDEIVLVGHSYGSWTSWIEASRYNDVDAVVLTGVSHQMPLVTALPEALNLYPAILDPAFGPFSGLDATYLTTMPGKRYQMFYAPSPVDPAVITHDEATKQTMTAGELAAFPAILVAPLDIRVPVLLVNGTDDGLFCRPEALGTDCSSAEALIAAEAPKLGPNVSSVDAYVLPGGGHDLNQLYNAGGYFEATQDWIASL